MSRNNQLVIVGVMLAVILAGFGIFIALAPKGAPATPAKTFSASDLVAPGSAMTGKPGAAVTLVEWGDFECPFCGAEAPALEQIIATYGSNPNFNFVFRNFPLPQHANARIGAEAAAAAGAQGKFWQMYQQLYAHQDQWTQTAAPMKFFDQYADAIGLDRARFDAALTARTYAPAVEADYQQAMKLGLDHTPSIFLNGTEVQAADLAALIRQIDATLAATASSTSAR